MSEVRDDEARVYLPIQPGEEFEDYGDSLKREGAIFLAVFCPICIRPILVGECGEGRLLLNLGQEVGTFTCPVDFGGCGFAKSYTGADLARAVIRDGEPSVIVQNIPGSNVVFREVEEPAN